MTLPEDDAILFLKLREEGLILSDGARDYVAVSGTRDSHKKLAKLLDAQYVKLEAAHEADSVPTPRYGQVFDVKEVRGEPIVGVYLAQREWGALFIELLWTVEEILTTVPEHVLLRYSLTRSFKYLTLLMKVAATSTEWRPDAQTAAKWEQLKERLDRMSSWRGHFTLDAAELRTLEVQLMAAKRMLRSGVVDGTWFYTIEAALLDARRWEAWFACGRLSKTTGVGAVSEALEVRESVEELQAWADALTDGQVRALVQKYCA